MKGVCDTMSMDIDFWRYGPEAVRDHDAVYQAACCEGVHVDGLEELPVSSILEQLAAAFSDWTRLSPTDYEHEDRGSFQVTTTPQSVRFDCYGMGEADLNRLIDVMLEFGCPLYDPQIAERFDGWTDK